MSPEAPFEFACEFPSALAEEPLPPEPDPRLPPLQSCPEPEVTLIDEIDDPFDAQVSEPIHLPRTHRPDARAFTLRLPRKARDPRPTPAPPARLRAVRTITRPPTLQANATPVHYPRRARRRGLEGSVELKILVLRTGRIGRIVLLRSSGHALLDEAARTAVAQWSFAPALRAGEPIATWMRRTIRFRLSPASSTEAEIRVR